MVLFLLGLGWYLPRYGYSSPDFLRYAHLHYALGVVVFAIFILRSFWRISSTTPAPLTSKTAAIVAVTAIKFFLYLLVMVVAISGYLICTSEGQTVNVFGLFEVPSIILLETEGVNVAGIAHKYTSWLLFGVVVIHAGAALIHHFIVGDATLKRMLKPEVKPKSDV